MDHSRPNDLLERLGRLSISAALAWALVTLAVLAPSAGAARTVYVSSNFADGVAAHSVGSGGRLTPIAGSPFNEEDSISPLGIAISPDAKHLYMTDGERWTVSVFAIAPDGSLSPIPGSPYATGVSPWGVAVTPDGQHLYVANRSSNSVSAYSVLFDGSLVPLPDPAVPTGGKGPNGVAVTPDGKNLYVTHLNSANVSAFSIAADGSLTPVEGSPFASGQTPRPVVVSPDGSYLYVAASTSEKIFTYSIGTGGVLSQVTGSPFATEGDPLGLAVTPNGKNLYAAHVARNHTVWGYSIGASGGLTTVPGNPFPSGGVRGNSAAVTPDGKYLYSTNNESDDISAYAIAATGGLQTLSGSPFDTFNAPLHIVVTPDQGPSSEFSATPTPAGNPLPFDASGSSDSDGSVASYHWDFGDGETEVTSTAATTHVYETADDYTVVLTVTDNSGCSTVQTFTGQTVSCNGSALARTSHQVTVPPGEPLSVSTVGSGSVTSSPSGIGCPGACSHAFEPGTQVTLTPNPAAGATFTGWSGGGCSGTGPCEVTVETDTGVTATFEELPPALPGGGCESGGCQSPPASDPPPAAPAPVPAQLRIKRVHGQNRVVIGGTIAAAARGTVRVKASGYVDGERVSVSRQAQIGAGRWRARLRLFPAGAIPDTAFVVVARFLGSPGVQGGQAQRRLSTEPAT